MSAMKIIEYIKKVKRIINSFDSFESGLHDLRIRIVDIQDRTYDAISQSRNTEYEILNSIKLSRLKDEIRHGKTQVKVVFLLGVLEKFEFASVYDAMLQNPKFDPVIVVISDRDLIFSQHPGEYERALAAYDWVRNRGYNALFAYDENGCGTSLWDLNPDIVFYNNPQLMQYVQYPNYYINANWLSCYISYFMPVLKNDNYLYGNPNITSAWKVFCPTRQFYESYITRQVFNKTQYYTFNGSNAVLTGYPKLDSYVSPLDLSKLPEGLCNKPIVIVAPHGNIRFDINIATFHLYYKKFMQLLDDFPDVNFVFKPHPNLKNRIREMEKLSEDCPLTAKEYEEYLLTWESKPNGFIITSGDYIDLFRVSSVLITDSGSFINEYLPSGHPCIYLLNPENKDEMQLFTDAAKDILSSYYCCNDWGTARSWLEKILAGIDPKREARYIRAQSELGTVGGAGAKIVEHIRQCIFD